MATTTRYFIGNWKMFGIPSSYKILNRINSYFDKDRKNNKKYKIIIAIPFVLLQDFYKKFRKKNIIISAQNCYHKDGFGAHTGNVSSLMIKKIGVNFIILGHSETRASGETEKIIKDKLNACVDKNFNIIYCIGENKIQKKKKQTIKVLKKQISNVIKKRSDFKKIIIAYEPIWSIGSGIVPKTDDLKKNIILLKKFIRLKYRLKNSPRIIYGGSVDKKNIDNFKSIKDLDGFLVGGASKSSKNFIDIIKNFYK